MTTPKREPAAGATNSPCFGRESELLLLMRMLQPNSPRVMHVHGVPGIGKTRLLRAFEERALERE